MRERMENHAPVATPQSAAAAAAAHIPWRRRRALGLTLKSQKNCAFFTADFSTGQPRQAPATVARHHRHRRRLATMAWRRRRRPRELQLRNCAVLLCGGAPPSGTTFLCLFDAMENQPSSGRWKNGAKNTIFKEREETLFCSLARAISNSYGGRFNKNLSRKSQRKLAFAMMDRIERNFFLSSRYNTS